MVAITKTVWYDTYLRNYHSITHYLMNFVIWHFPICYITIQWLSTLLPVSFKHAEWPSRPIIAVRANHAKDVAPEGGFLFTSECAKIANNLIALGIARHPFFNAPAGSVSHDTQLTSNRAPNIRDSGFTLTVSCHRQQTIAAHIHICSILASS